MIVLRSMAGFIVSSYSVCMHVEAGCAEIVRDNEGVLIIKAYASLYAYPYSGVCVVRVFELQTYVCVCMCVRVYVGVCECPYSCVCASSWSYLCVCLCIDT
jgi:hypothetical protein